MTDFLSDRGVNAGKPALHGNNAHLGAKAIIELRHPSFSAEEVEQRAKKINDQVEESVKKTTSKLEGTESKKLDEVLADLRKYLTIDLIRQMEEGM